MRNAKITSRLLSVLLAGGLTAGLLSGCAHSAGGEQRYAYPLGTASPEDTVTQIYAA